MRWLPSLCLSAAVLALSSLTPSAAFADDPNAAALIERGLDLRQAQHDPEALVLFEEAQALAPSPRGQAQVALVQQALGRWAAAERNLKGALAATDDAWIVSRRPILEHALGVIESHLGDVEIVGATSGKVFVDGAEVNDRDALTHLRLEIGRRTLELRAAGSYPFSRVLDVRPGETVRVEVDQRPLLEAPKAITPAALLVSPPPPPPSGSAQRTLGWVALGGAGLFVATGVFGLLDRSIAAGNFNGSASCTGTPSNQLSAQCRGWLDDGTTGQTVAIIGFVGAGLVGALSAALLLTAPSSKPKAVAWSVPCMPTPTGVTCAIGGTF